MWYLAWVLGIIASILFAVVCALWLEAQEAQTEEKEVFHNNAVPLRREAFSRCGKHHLVHSLPSSGRF